MVKGYKYGKFTNFLLKSKSDRLFEITGPFVNLLLFREEE